MPTYETQSEREADARGYVDALNDCVTWKSCPYSEGTPEHRAYWTAVQLYRMDV